MDYNTKGQQCDVLVLFARASVQQTIELSVISYTVALLQRHCDDNFVSFLNIIVSKILHWISGAINSKRAQIKDVHWKYKVVWKFNLHM